MRALVRAELASRRRSLIGLGGGAFGLLLMVALSYHSLGLGALGHAFSGAHTPAALSALSGSRHGDLISPHGWMSFGFNHPMFLVLTLTVAISVGAATIAGEVEIGRAELLFVRPRARSDFLLAGLAVWAVAELAVVGGGLVGALAGAALAPDLRHAGLLALVLAPLQYLPLTFSIAGVAFLSSALARTRGRATGAAVGVTLLAYLANFVSTLIADLDWLRWLTPFGYYDPLDAVQNGFDWAHAAVLLAAGALLALAAARVLERRDLA